MKTNQQSRQSIVRLSILFTLFVIVLLGCSEHALGQWTNGTDISNTNSGNVGVGTTTPAYKLDIMSSSNILARFRSSAAAHTQLLFDAPTGYNTNLTLLQGGTPQWYLGNRAADNRFSFIESTGTTEVFSILQNGNVGIGTVAPNYKFEVYGSASRNSLAVTGDGDAVGYAGIKIQALTTTGIATNRTSQFNLHMRKDSWYGGDGSGPSFIIESVSKVGGYAAPFLITPTNDVILNGGSGASGLSYGKVGIGTTSPAFKLDVGGQIHSSTGGFVFPDGTVQTTAAGNGGGGTITSVTGGAGLTGSGTNGAVTLDVGAGTGVSVTADSISVNYGSSAGTAVQGNTSITVSAGDGMSGGGPLTLGAGGTVSLTNTDKGSSQSIFKNVANAAGTTQFSASSNNDAVRFEGTGGSSVSFDANTKKVTIDSSGIISSQWTTDGSNINYASGNVGIGNTNPTAALDVTGDIKVSGNINAKYQDIAEWVPATRAMPAGTVAVLNPNQSNQVMASAQAYDTRVAGVVSERPGLALGESGKDKVLVATSGRVRVRVDATRAPIHIGDLLVASDKEGMAMKSQPISVGGVEIHRPGTLIGKALEPLEKGTGEILVLLSLQ